MALSTCALLSLLLLQGAVRVHSLPILEGLIDPDLQPKFTTVAPNLLPKVQEDNHDVESFVEIGVREGVAYTGLVDKDKETPLGTPIYGYEGTWPGPTVSAKSFRPLQVKWKNQLSPGQFLLTNNEGESLLESTAPFQTAFRCFLSALAVLKLTPDKPK